jgi:hypothetical protein
MDGERTRDVDQVVTLTWTPLLIGELDAGHRPPSPPTQWVTPGVVSKSRNSSFTYKGKAVDIKQVGRELSVRYALEGSVRKVANRLRIGRPAIQADISLLR